MACLSEPVVSFLLDTDPSLMHAVDEDGWNALHFTCTYDCVVGTCVDDDCGDTALHLACMNGCPNVASLLIRSLHIACRNVDRLDSGLSVFSLLLPSDNCDLVKKADERGDTCMFKRSCESMRTTQRACA